MAGMSHRDRVVHQAAARLLDYPDAAWWRQLPLVQAALTSVGGKSARQLAAFLDQVSQMPDAKLTSHYVEVFDFKNRHSLYLTWWLDGDTRRRGASLVELLQTFRDVGFAFDGSELPDFLPVVLEYTAASGDPAKPVIDHIAADWGISLARHCAWRAPNPQ